MALRNKTVLVPTSRDLRGLSLPPITDAPKAWMRGLVFADIVLLPVGQFQYYVTSLKRARRGDLTKKIQGRHIRRDARDVRWSQAVRKNYPFCRAAVSGLREGGKVYHVCSQTWKHESEEGAHIISRRYKRTRLVLENGIGLCRSAHAWFTDHPKEWEHFCRLEIGNDLYDDLHALARGLPCSRKFTVIT